MRHTPTCYLCAEHYDQVIEAITVLGELEALTLLEVAMRLPPGGLDKVLILRAEAPPRNEGGRWRWVQLALCQFCGSVSGNGDPLGSR